MSEAPPEIRQIEDEHFSWLAESLKLDAAAALRAAFKNLPSLNLLSFSEGHPIVEEGERGRDVFVLHKGEARVFKGGREIAALKPGDVFGEIGFLLKDGRRTATVKAEGGCEAFRCDAEEFEAFLLDNPALMTTLSETAKARLGVLK